MPDLFTFNREETEDILAGAEGNLLLCGPRDTADEYHSAVDYAQELGAITGPDNGKISIYPQSMDEPTPILVASTGGTVLMGGELSYPDDDGDGAEAWTCEFLAEMVNAANNLLVELRARTHPPCTPQEDGPSLIYAFSGIGLPLHKGGPMVEWEMISGAFRVVCWLPVAGAIIGNGEAPEGIWAVADNPERAV